MATITLTANTNVSALSLANGDTIDLAGFTLTIDAQPAATGVQVVSPGTAGRVSFSSGWDLSTWDFFVGTSGSGGMIATLPAGASIGSITAGGSNHRGVATNNGSIGLACGGTVAGSHGVTTNNAFVGRAKAGTANNAHGVLSNSGTVITAESVAGNSNGVNTNAGQLLRLVTGSAPAVAAWNGTLCFVEGPFVNGAIPDNIKTIYSLGTLSDDATIASDATVITLNEGSGGGASFPPIGPGGLVY